jgi:hypothetical protein
MGNSVAENNTNESQLHVFTTCSKFPQPPFVICFNKTQLNYSPWIEHTN